ncbi:12208_t:CDS:2 [Entrophospora sp. SA101]|nr:12208_t:CDS:2 [Entrophospora sp. SA101]
MKHQKEQKELELARKYRMLNEANIGLEKENTLPSSTISVC